jgi:hypothetical protein
MDETYIHRILMNLLSNALVSENLWTGNHPANKC